MLGSWTFGRKLGAGFAIAIVALVVVATIGYQSTYRLIDNDDAVFRAQRARRLISRILSLLKDAETGARGFIITGDDAFLEPFRAAAGEMDQGFAAVDPYIADSSEQQRRLIALRPMVDQKLASLQASIDQRRSAGFETTARTVASGEGRQTMDRIRALVDEMDGVQERLVVHRKEEAEASADLAKELILWGSLAAIAVVVVIAFLITRSLSKQIGAAVRHVQSSAAELQAAATQQATSARQQATAMTEISTTISELVATSRQIAESSQRVAQIADQTASAARSGDATVDRGNESVAAIRRQVDLVVNSMLELGKKSQQVGAVLDIVSELAEQTNILAINATIEAAGAGDAGRRFGVVADEIRKLADRVTGSTKEIRGLVDDVRSAVSATVMTTETGSKAVDAGSRQFAEVATAFEHIVGRVMTATDAAREIELSTKQQATAVEQVTIAITSVAQASKETEVSTGQTLQTASELAGLSRDLLRLVQPQASA